MPVQAQNIQAIESSTIGAQVEYNNQWGQSFEATGPNIQGGGSGGSIFPFANVYTPGAAIQGDNQNSLDQHHTAAEGLHYESHGHDLLTTSPVVVTPLIVPNSGRATFSASVTDLTLHGGNLTGEGEIVASSSSSNIILNQDPMNGVPSIRFNPRIRDIETVSSLSETPESSLDDNDTVAANILGTNIGVDVIQVTGTNSYTVVNTLSAF